MPPITPLKLLLPLLLALPVPGSAAVAWHCWYNLDEQVACLVRQVESAGPLSAGLVRTLETVAAIKAPARLRSDGLPPSLRLLREQPGALRGRTILIPLHAEPFDTALVAELVRAVMCGREPDCTAHYGERPVLTLADAADLVDANDPLLTSSE